jgi:hypothetical protein
MSKKEILQSLAYQQQQDVATMNRMLVALARTLKIDPEEMAKNFVDQEGNRVFAEQLNTAMDKVFAATRPTPPPSDSPADDTLTPPATDDQVVE